MRPNSCLNVMILALARTEKWNSIIILPYTGPAIRPLVQKHGQGYDKYAKYYNSVYLRHNIHLFSPPGSRTNQPAALYIPPLINFLLHGS